MTATSHPLLLKALSQADALPSLPAVAGEILGICRDDNASLGDLANVLSRDPALAAKLLRFANSSLYSMEHEATTLQRATLVLGLKTVQLISLSFSLATHLPRKGNMPGFDYDLFWQRSLARAVSARSMASLIDSSTDDEAFLCGLLSGVGRLILAECLPGTYAEVLTNEKGGWPTLDQETTTMGFNSSDVASVLMEQWNMPELIRLSIQHAHTPDALPEGTPTEIATNTRILHLATLTVDLLTANQKGEALSKLEEKADEYFHIGSELLYEYITSLDGSIREASDMLNVSPPKGMTHEEILAAARSERIRVSNDLAEGALPKQETGRDPFSDFSDLEPKCPRAGIPNDEAFQKHLTSELKACLHGEEQGEFGMLRIHFDAYGEASKKNVEGATAVLRKASSCLHPVVRKGDLLAYMGEGEFAILVREGSPENLQILASRIRKEVSHRQVAVDGASMPLTMTIAGATLSTVTDIGEGTALKEATSVHLQRLLQHGMNQTYVQAVPLANLPE